MLGWAIKGVRPILTQQRLQHQRLRPTKMAAFTHDLTNLEAYPIVTVCLETMAYWWILPFMSTVSHGLRTTLNNDYYKRAGRLALRVRTAARMFRLKAEQYRFKMIMIKHLWTIWNKPGNGDPISNRLAVLTSAFSRTNCYRPASKDVVKKLGLSLLGWDPAFNVLVRLAIWMQHFGFAESTLYTVFAARMDLLFMELAASYPYRLDHGHARFSKYIQSMCDSPSHQLWVWSITQRPRGCVYYNEMHALWSYGRRGVLHRHWDGLSCYVQSASVLLCAYGELHKRRGTHLPARALSLCVHAQIALSSPDDAEAIVID